MRCTRSTHSSHSTDPRNGFTLVELLVSMLLSVVLLAVLVTDFAFTVRTRQGMDLLVETQQGLQSALAIITQELRQAGACLPKTGDFVAVTGNDDGLQDSLAIRIGLVDPLTVTCIQGVLQTTAPIGSTTLDLDDASGFEVGHVVYLTRPAGNGNYFQITGVLGGNLLQITPPTDKQYDVASGVYAIEERLFQLDTTGGEPVLTMGVDGGDPIPLVHGVEELDVRYLLAPCPPCAAVNEPSDDAEWHAVRAVEFNVSVRSTIPKADGQYIRLRDGSHIRPRNLT